MTATLIARGVVREASLEDLDRIALIANRFVTEVFTGKIVPTVDQCRETLRWVLDQPVSKIFVADGHDGLDGAFALVVTRHMVSGELFAGEVMWWVNPESRGRLGLSLLRAAERWARSTGAKFMQISATSARVESLIERLGYTKIEVSYQQRFTDQAQEAL